MFLSVKGPELLNKFVGESERLIRMIFKRARERAAEGKPVIVFIDEMDSLLRTRGSGVSSDVETTIVPQFLAELDGVETLDNVMVIGASNRIDMIDPAVLRPGRLDVKIRVERPKAAQAAQIIRHYLTDDLPLVPELDAKALIGVLVNDIYANDEHRHLCDVRDEHGQWHPVYLADVVSGAVLKNIVDRAKTRAVKISIEDGRPAAIGRRHAGQSSRRGIHGNPRCGAGRRSGAVEPHQRFGCRACDQHPPSGVMLLDNMKTDERKSYR